MYKTTQLNRVQYDTRQYNATGYFTTRHTSESKLQPYRDIATYRLNRPQGRTALPTLPSTDSVICKQIPRPYQCRSQSDHAEDVYWVFSCVTEAE